MAESKHTIEPSVVYRTGRLIKRDYDEAIETLIGARDEDPSKMCGSCHDTGHTAETCHHNPLVLARRGAKKEHEFRCFHCGYVFTGDAAQEHFGQTEHDEPACLQATNKALLEALNDIHMRAYYEDEPSRNMARIENIAFAAIKSAGAK